MSQTPGTRGRLHSLDHPLWLAGAWHCLTRERFDLPVIEADPVSKREEMQRLHRAVHDLPYPVDVWVMGEQEFEETKHIIGGLAYPAHKYGGSPV